MKNKIKLILSIFLAIIFIIVAILYFNHKNILNNIKTIIPNNNSIEGIIENEKITKDEQYIYVKDKNNKEWKIIISDNTIFKEKLRLENGDNITIKGNRIDDNSFQATEISGLMLQKN